MRFAPDPKKVDAVTELPTDTLVAVTIPVTCIPLPPTVVALPNVETPETDKLSKNLTLVDVVMLSVDATPVNPPPSPENDVAVTTPTKKPLPSGLSVVPLPTSTPLLAVMRPTESILVTSS